MATPNYTGTDEELQKALAALQHAHILAAPLLTDNFKCLLEKVVRSLDLRVLRRQRDLVKEIMRRPRGRPRVRDIAGKNE